jgi:hypothetical protein
MENFQNDQLMGMDLQADNQVRQQLYESAKWTKFIAIVMFVACGLLLIAGIIGGAALHTVLKRVGGVYDFLENFDTAVIIGAVVIVVAVLVLIYYFLYNFSRKIKSALISENTAEFNAGLKSLKTFLIITTVFATLSLLNSIAQLFY